MNYLNPNCFEKTKEAVGFFSFFSFTNVETKNVCPIAYNVSGLCVRWGFPALKPIDSTNFNLSTNDYR
jgi:hypothetical protein